MSLDERLEGGEPVPIVRWGDPVLHRPGRPVTAFDEDLWDLLRTMFATNRAAQGAGLAAAQIGVDLDVFVYDCEDASGRRRRGVVCNPKLAQLPAAREEVIDEGCLSLPGAFAPVARPDGDASPGDPVTDPRGSPGPYRSPMDAPAEVPPLRRARIVARGALALFLATAGIGHLVAPEPFLAQVPPWLALPELVVLVSGLVELALAVALVALPRHRRLVGWLVATFLVLVFPGNVSQAVAGTDALGLDTRTSRWVRLAFQPVLIAWALWATEAWWGWRVAERSRRHPPRNP